MKSSFVSFVLILLAVVGINVIFSTLDLKIDATEERLYTLSDGSKAITQKLEQPLRLKYYFAKDTENIPLQYKAYGRKVEDLLREFVALNPDQLSLAVHNPLPDTDEEEWANRYGLTGAEAGDGSTFYMGLVVLRDEKEFPIPFFDIRRETFLEYDIAKILFEAGAENRKQVGIFTPLDIQGTDPQLRSAGLSQGQWAFLNELEKFYSVEVLDWANTTFIPAEMDYLIVIHPYGINEFQEYAIDQFLMRGGNLVVLIDPFMRGDARNQLMRSSGQRDFVSESNLPTLLPSWGVEYLPYNVLGDRNRAMPVGSGINYTLWHSLTASAFNPDLIAANGLENVLLVEPGSFTFDPQDKGLRLTPIIQSTEGSGVVSARFPAASPPEITNKAFQSDGKIRELSAILNGTLASSAFSAPPAYSEDMIQPPMAHIAKGQAAASILLITDADFIADPFSVRKFSLFGQEVAQPLNDNHTFLLNMIDFLSGSEEMMAIRARGTFSRPLEVFDRMQNEAEAKYYSTEAALNEQLEAINKELSQLRPQEGESQISLTAEQNKKIKEFREEELQTKKKLREIRKLLRQDVEVLQTRLMLINMLAIPVIVIISGVVVYIRRSHRKRR